MLAALIGAGKTTHAMNLTRAWALELEFLGRQCRQSRTLVVVSPKEYEAWADTIGFWGLKDLVFLVESTKAHFSDRVKWFDFLMQRNGGRTFVLDTLFDFFGMPPNTSGDANRIAMSQFSVATGGGRQLGHTAAPWSVGIYRDRTDVGS
jgi:hypothetical protein